VVWPRLMSIRKVISRSHFPIKISIEYMIFCVFQKYEHLLFPDDLQFVSKRKSSYLHARLQVADCFVKLILLARLVHLRLLDHLVYVKLLIN